jgi:hypothetical protein
MFKQEKERKMKLLWLLSMLAVVCNSFNPQPDPPGVKEVLIQPVFDPAFVPVVIPIANP